MSETVGGKIGRTQGLSIGGLLGPPKSDGTTCDSCGSSMVAADGSTHIGVRLTTDCIPQEVIPRHKTPFDFSICWSCWLESLGIKGNREGW